MKVLRSPWVTGGLVVVAVAVVFYQLVWPHMGRSRGAIAKQAKAAVQAVTPGAKKAVEAPPPPPKVAAASSRYEGAVDLPKPMDREAAREAYPRWIAAPDRDPFFLVPPEPDADDGTNNSPIAQWKLKGIWSQTGSRVAAINSGVYREGDVVEQYPLQKIERDQVWLLVSNRLERLSMFYTGTSGQTAKPGARNK